MDRCVKDIMAKQKVDKETAIAICHKSIVKEEADMSSSRKKRKQDAVTPEETPTMEIKEEQADAPEVEEKDYDMESDWQPSYGANSFAELDAARNAADMSKQTRQNASDLQAIISNILYDDNVTDKPAAIKSATDEFKARLDAMPKAENKSKSIVEYLTEFKAKLTSAAINNLPDSAFAYIEPGGKKDKEGKTVPRSKRHFPINDAAHVRDALSRAPQSPFGSKAMPKILAAAKKFGVKASKELPPITFYKDKEDNWRWMGVVSNNFQDSSKEIISAEAHREFVQYLDAHPESAPLFVPWHTLGLARKHRIDFWDFAEDNDGHGLFYVGGRLEKDEAEALMKSSEGTVLGMSHGFFVLQKDEKNDNIISKYRTFEVSDLPLENAANPWTALSIDTLTKEAEMKFKPKKREYLIGQIGEEAVKQIEDSGQKGMNILGLLGIASKEADIEDPETPVENASQEENAEETEQAPEEEALQQVVNLVGKELGIDKLSNFLQAQDKELKDLRKANTDLTNELKQLRKSKDEEIAEEIAPKVIPFWMRKDAERASESDETVVDENTDPELAEKAKPGSWVSEVVGGEPL